MKTSASGRAAITRREGNELRAYKDSVGVLTIGVGHTSMAGPPKVTSGMKITAKESDEILSRDLAKFEAAVNNAVKVPLSQNQFDALVSLAFNIGGGAFAKSTLVRKLNAKDYAGAADSFLSWNKAGGKVLKGLTIRRQDERKQFLSGKPASAKKPAPAPSPVIEPKPAPAPSPVTDKELIKRVQTGLTLLRYQPGGADGVIGPLTAGAIRNFRADNGLPEGDFIDDALITALSTAKPREMVPARANATPAQIAKIVPEAKSHVRNKIAAIGGGAATLVAGAVDQLGSATSYLQPVRDFIGEVPTWVWFAAVLGVAGFIAWNARKGQKAADQAYRSGDRR